MAFKCVENNTPVAAAFATCAARNSSKAFADINVPSTTSPAKTFRLSRSTVSVPSAATCLMVSTSAAGMMTDCSLWRKSLASIVATFVWESLDHTPMRCGCFLAKFLTAPGARRSELPSRNTGFTADPLTAS